MPGTRFRGLCARMRRAAQILGLMEGMVSSAVAGEAWEAGTEALARARTTLVGGRMLALSGSHTRLTRRLLPAALNACFDDVMFDKYN